MAHGFFVLLTPVRFLQEVVSELKKVTWPTRMETLRSTILVIGISLLVGIYISVLDVGFAKALEFVLTK